MTSDPMIAILDQLAEHAEQIARLDARDAASTDEANRRLADLAVLAASLDGHVAELAALTARIRPQSPGGPAAAVQEPAAAGPGGRWWEAAGTGRDQAVAGLRAWVEQVYRPGYGQLAVSLGTCWDQHDLCLYALDILAGLWSYLYLAAEQEPGVLSAQAEYQARILPALAEQMSAETSRCRHARERLSVARPARRTS
jgi:hypothetical protein